MLQDCPAAAWQCRGHRQGLSGEKTEEFFAGLELELIRPARKDEKQPRCFPNWLRQRVEAIIWTLKNQLMLLPMNSVLPHTSLRSCQPEGRSTLLPWQVRCTR